MFQKVFLFFLIFFASLVVNAQLFTGGNFSVNYSNGVNIDAAPEIGYRFFSKLEIGVAPFVTYSKPTGATEANISYGGRVFTRYDIFQGFYASANFEAINANGGSDFNNWIFAMPLGAGFRYTIGHTSVYSEILYDVILDKNSGRENPIIRGGINYNF